jgi:hypothetical protein
MDNFQDWKMIENGITVCSGELKKQKVTWHCVRINLDTPNLKFISLPRNDTLGTKFYLKNFAKYYKTVIAINTSPFDLRGKTYIPEGVTKLNNRIITEPVFLYSALCLRKNPQGFWRAKIVPHQTEAELENWDYAYGGFFSVLENRELISFQKNRRSRTACGVNEDGSVLYLFVTTPRFYPSDRNGMNYEECAIILRELGCTNAMQFDGGHSSGLCIYTDYVEKPVFQRKVPVALGFFR